MTKATLINTIARLLTPPKGILAIDEKLSTCNSRFEKLGVPTTVEKRREYRELLITAPEIEKYISGYILFDETIRQYDRTGRSFTSIMKDKGLEIGIKVDKGTVDDDPLCPGEKVTVGLEGLFSRLKEYKTMGATFAKWRVIYKIGEGLPTEACLLANANALAEYATICQGLDIVPIVEPEVLIDGKHSIEKCYEITKSNLAIVFSALQTCEVFLPGVILKTNMVLPGIDSEVGKSDEEIARMTVKCLKESIPENIGGIVFLSGGQKDEEATRRLNEMHKLGPLPWPLTFSYGRAIQNPALESWAKNPADVAGAQNLLLIAAEVNSLASIGKYEEK